MISYSFAGVEIVWTNHAIHRAKTRFRNDVQIENEAIVWTFLRTTDKTFQVKNEQAILTCKRNGENKVMILTVYPAGWKRRYKIKRKKRKLK
jgi:hypothetical protein